MAANYYEHLNAKELLASRESSLKDAELIFEAANEMHQAGLRSSNDLATSKATVAQMQMDLAQQKAHVGITYGKLMTSMGLSVETEMAVQTMPEGLKNPLFAEGVPQLIAVAEQQRKDLLAKKATVAEAKALVKKAKRAPLPKFRTSDQIGWLQYTKNQGNGYNYNVGVSLDFPIFRGFEFSYQKKRALAEAEMTEAELIELQNDIALEVLTFSKSVEAAQEALKWSDQYLDEATKSYEGALCCYKSGLQNIFDLLQSQRYLSDARIKKAQARTQWLVSLAELAFATGSLSP